MKMQQAIVVNGLAKQLGKFTFGPIHFHAEEGTATAVVGPNGSGKTTFFRLLLNLLRPDQGLIEIEGLSGMDQDQALKQQVGFAGGGLLQGLGNLKIQELAAFASHWYPNWDRDRYLDLVNRYEVDEEEKYNRCSTGTKKKIEFIFALSYAPRLLILDEPTAGVDMISQRKMREDLISFMEDGEHTMLIATHIVDDVRLLCDYVTVFHNGAIRGHFNKDEITQRWARVWVSELPNQLRNAPFVKSIDTSSNVIITDDFSELDDWITEHGVDMVHLERLSLDEVMEHLIEDVKFVANLELKN